MQTIAVIGAGTMGAGIAQLAATHGCIVHLIDVNHGVVERAHEGIAKQVNRLVEKGKMNRAEGDAILGRIRPSAVIEGNADLGEVELAIEAVVEELAIKHKVFAALERATPPSAVLATNTSSLSVSRIAEVVERPGRVVGMHFFNPAPVMPLVEIIAGEKSDSASLDFAFQTAKAWGKVPVRVADTPGFIVNRVARGYYLEALRLLDEGVGGVDEIDAVMRRHGGFKMGPFELMDLVGLDVNLAVSTSVWEQMGKPARLAPHEIQRTLVTEGHLGRKSGRGFYSYDGGHTVPMFHVKRRSFALSPLLSDVLRAFTVAAGADGAGGTEQFIFSRILAAIINEAGFALAENVASREDIDVAMVHGTNYPSGPLAWAEEIGHRTVRGVLRSLNESVTDRRYDPSPSFALGCG